MYHTRLQKIKERTFEFICASHKEEVLKQNLLRSPILEKYPIKFQKGFTNICKAYNKANSKADIQIYVHHDVYLPETFENDLMNGIAEIDNIDPNWGVIGVAGVVCIDDTTKVSYGYLSDRGTTWGNKKGLPHEVDTLDELILITKGDFKFDEKILSQHFFGADICLQAKRQGKKNYVIEAFLEHNSGLIKYSKLPKEFYRERKYIANKYKDLLPTATTCTIIPREERSRIFYSIPWNSDKNIGKYYNYFMKTLDKDSDYACFIDGDAMFTTSSYGKQLEDIVGRYLKCGLFTCMTNRIGNKTQRDGNWDSDNILDHRNIGEELFKTKYAEVEDITNKEGDLMGGVMILIRKDVWKKLGGFSEKGMLGVDNDIQLKAREKGEKVFLMKGVYLYHYYRGGDQLNNKHLQK